MDSDSARAKLDAIRRKLERDLDKTRTHFGMHMLYINAFDDLEEFARTMALADSSNG